MSHMYVTGLCGKVTPQTEVFVCVEVCGGGGGGTQTKIEIN